MIKRDDLILFLTATLDKDFLQKASVIDDFANGVQIIGDDEVKKIAIGVSLTEEFLEKALKLGADFCVFHHGIDTHTYKSRFPIYQQKRLKLIFQNNLTISGYHYSLDAHPELGNNAQIIQKLGAYITNSLFEEWGYIGVFENEKTIDELEKECRKLFGNGILAFKFGKSQIKTIGVVSGSGKPHQVDLEEMELKNVDLYISGETSEHVPAMMKESGINYFVCGHYATEVFGIKALGDKIKKQFGDKIEVEFIDVENPI